MIEATHEYGREPRQALDHICEQDHEGCYMHPAKKRRLDSDGTFTQDDRGDWHEVSTEAQRAQARQATVPTMAEWHGFSVHPGDHVIEYERGGMFCHTCGKWIKWPAPQSYGVMPAKLADRGEAGWDRDSDRDSRQAAKLAVLVAKLDSMARVWLAGSADQSVSLALADDMANTWQAIRKITQGNQP